MNIKKAVAYILCTTFIFVSCNRDEIAEETTQQQPIVEYVESTEPEEIIKEEIIFAGSTHETDGMRRIIRDYNSQSKYYEVVMHELGMNSETSFHQIVQDSKEVNAKYDIVEIDLSRVAEFADSGFSMPLDDFIQRDGIDLSEYLPSAIKSVMYTDRVLAMPLTVSIGMMYFRTDIISAPPKDWDELLRLSTQLKGRENTENGYILAGRYSGNLVLQALEIIHSYGGQLMDIDGNVSIDVENTRRGLEKLSDIYNSDVVQKRLYMMNNLDVGEIFAEGKSVFMRNEPYMRELINKSALVRSNYAIAPLPRGSEDSEIILSGRAVVMNADSENVEGAWDFIKYLSGYEGQKALAVHGGEIPSLLPVLQDFDVLVVSNYFATNSFLNAIESAQPKYITPNYVKRMEIFEDILASYIQGEITVETALANLEIGMNTIR